LTQNESTRLGKRYARIEGRKRYGRTGGDLVSWKQLVRVLWTSKLYQPFSMESPSWAGGEEIEKRTVIHSTDKLWT